MGIFISYGERDGDVGSTGDGDAERIFLNSQQFYLSNKHFATECERDALLFQEKNQYIQSNKILMKDRMVQ